MADQLVLFINRAADTYRWCWLDAQLRPRLDTEGSGNAEALAATLQGGSHQAWLILPGTKVITREIDYTEKEKKHLRSLIPFQLEEAVIGDVDRFHFALAPLVDGKTVVTYLEKAWLEEVVAQLAAMHIEVTRCWAAPATLPLAPAADADLDTTASADAWTLQVYENVVLVRYDRYLAFSADLPHAAMALQLLLTAQKRVDRLPRLTLRATSEQELRQLEEGLPSNLQNQVAERRVVNLWDLDYTNAGIDLCQGDFSQRLPMERWWRNWRGVAMLAAACFGVHVGILLYQIHDFRQQNLEIRREIETAYRRAVPQGALVDAERQLSGLVRELQPVGQGGKVTHLLAKVLPPIAQNSAVSVRSIQYLGDTGEMNLQLQASEFNAIQNLHSQIEQQGLRAELLGSSAQGNTHSARLKISQINPR